MELIVGCRIELGTLRLRRTHRKDNILLLIAHRSQNSTWPISLDVVSSRFLHASSITSYHFKYLHNIPHIMGGIGCLGCFKFNSRCVNNSFLLSVSETWLHTGITQGVLRNTGAWVPPPSRECDCGPGMGIFQRFPQILVYSRG